MSVPSTYPFRGCNWCKPWRTQTRSEHEIRGGGAVRGYALPIFYRGSSWIISNACFNTCCEASLPGMQARAKVPSRTLASSGCSAPFATMLRCICAHTIISVRNASGPPIETFFFNRLQNLPSFQYAAAPANTSCASLHPDLIDFERLASITVSMCSSSVSRCASTKQAARATEKHSFSKSSEPSQYKRRCSGVMSLRQPTASCHDVWLTNSGLRRWFFFRFRVIGLNDERMPSCIRS